jgi:hypothetical protein
LAERYDLNPKTVAKWKKRDFVEDASMGPKMPHSTALTDNSRLTRLNRCSTAVASGPAILARSEFRS